MYSQQNHAAEKRRKACYEIEVLGTNTKALRTGKKINETCFQRRVVTQNTQSAWAYGHLERAVRLTTSTFLILTK